MNFPTANLSTIIELKDLPMNLKISTMTVTCRITTLINIRNVGKYIDLEHGSIVYVDDGSEIRSLIKYKQSNTKKKRNFFNQTTLIIDVKDKRRVNVKLFKNGAIQITGCKSSENFNDAIEILYKELTKKKFIHNKIKNNYEFRKFVTNSNFTVINFRIRMINSNFYIGFLIDRERLYELLTRSLIRCNFEPCIHACVNIKYCYKNKDIISIFVFESGSIIITGAKNKNHIIEAYKFIIRILYEKYDKIVKTNIDEFLNSTEIKQLIMENQTQINNSVEIIDYNKIYEY